MTSYLKLLPAVAWLMLSFFLLTLPGKNLPSAGWMDHLQIDKIVHIFLFFVLVTFFFWGIVSTKPGIHQKNTLLAIAVLALAYGIAMEFVQKYYIPNRSFDAWDVVADGIGSFLPMLLIVRIQKLFKLV
jgi:VanZ family protein